MWIDRTRVRWIGLLAAAWMAVASAGDADVTEAEGLQQVRDLVVPSPYRISPLARAGTIRYRVRLEGVPAGWTWPETGEQHANPAGDAVVLTICTSCGHAPFPTQDDLAGATSSTPWLESRDRRIVAFARAAGRGSVDARMRRLVAAVQQRLSGAVDYRGYRTARAAYDARDGDCTEYALLLAAAARAQGIPSRVIAGLAYASRFVGQPHAFGPHMWVQAWDGQRWTSYDAGLGAFDAGHIAVVVGDGSPDSLKDARTAVGSLRFETVEGVLPAATADASR